MKLIDIEFWKEFFAALYPEYHYANIESPLHLIDLNFILIGLYVGIVVGSAIMCYRKSHMGTAVRAILKAGAHSEEDAKTPEELGIEKRRTLVNALRKQKFGGLVKRAGITAEEAMTGKPDYTDERYYIPEDRRYQAEDRYSRRGIGIGMVIFWAIVLIPVFMGIRFLIPEVLQFLDNFITTVK